MNRALFGFVLCTLFALAHAHKPTQRQIAAVNGTEANPQRVCGQQKYEEYLMNKYPHVNWNHEHFESTMAKMVQQSNGE